LLQAFTLLRPMLRDAVAQQGPSLFGRSVGELVAGLSLLQVVVQAAGVGLIIAAVLTARPQTQTADHGRRNS